MNTKCCLFLIILLLSFQCYSQKIVNLVLVGPNGVTEDLSIATSFIVVKQYPDLHFERLDYKKGGPLTMLRSYKDEDLKILEGRFFEYAKNGSVAVAGHYADNLKTSDWNNYDETGKVVNRIKYLNDSIVDVADLNVKDSAITYADEKEAVFPGGDKAWIKYLLKSLSKDNPAEKSFQGGNVFINFVVNTEGIVTDLYVSKSVEFILDETSLKIIAESPKWNPAFQNGKFVRAYRRQPLTFVQQ